MQTPYFTKSPEVSLVEIFYLRSKIKLKAKTEKHFSKRQLQLAKYMYSILSHGELVRTAKYLEAVNCLIYEI